jgi:hypothetical protein
MAEKYMNLKDLTDCTETLLDLLCYEVCRGKLSPEMEELFSNHLAECPRCRSRVSGYMEVLGGGYLPFQPQVGGNN